MRALYLLPYDKGQFSLHTERINPSTAMLPTREEGRIILKYAVGKDGLLRQMYNTLISVEVKGRLELQILVIRLREKRMLWCGHLRH